MDMLFQMLQARSGASGAQQAAGSDFLPLYESEEDAGCGEAWAACQFASGEAKQACGFALKADVVQKQWGAVVSDKGALHDQAVQPKSVTKRNRLLLLS